MAERPSEEEERGGDELLARLAARLDAAEPHWLFTLEHAAQLLDVSVFTIRRLIAAGELRPVRLLGGRRIHVRADDLAALIDRATGS